MNKDGRKERKQVRERVHIGFGIGGTAIWILKCPVEREE